MKLFGIPQRFIAYDTLEQNTFIESYHGKKKYVWPFEFSSFQDANKAISEAFVDYNKGRPHSSLGYARP
ncbi:MAG: integrase core domain-containing protein [Thermoplasmata archaeon]